MKFAYTIIYVEDVAHTLEFYEKAFGFQRKFMTPEQDYAELVTGETTLAFASKELGESNFSKAVQLSSKKGNAFAVELAFTTEDINKDWKVAVEAGAEVFEPVVEKPWGQSVGYLRDCNGFLIEICTPIKQ